MNDLDELELLKRKVAREVLARKQAEALLEDKARELYQVNESLQKLNETLEERVQSRTQELDKINSNLQQEVDTRAAAEARLQLTQMAVDRSGDAIFWATKDSKIIYANQSACRLLGYSRAELLEKHVYDIDPDFDEHNWPEHWLQLQALQRFSNERTHIRKAGDGLPVEVNESLVKYGDREFNCVHARDISQRKNDELRLRLQGQLLALIAMGQSADLVFEHVCDRLQQLLGDAFCAAVHDDRPGAIASGWRIQQSAVAVIRHQLSSQNENIPAREVTVTRDLDEENWGEAANNFESRGIKACWSCPIFWEEREIGVLAVFVKEDRDPNDFEDSLITSAAAICGIAFSRQRSEMYLQVARDRAESANRSKSEFLANMSHEIRTPITAVIGYADLLSVPKGRSERDVKWAKQILKSAEHLKALLNDILDLSQVEAGELSIQRTNVELKPFLTEIVDMFEQRVREKLLTFQWEIQDLVPQRIVADQTRLRQILTNLLSNAIKFTAAGNVDLNVYESAGEIRFEIKDTGIGIAAGQLRQIFEPFRRVDGRPDAPGGTGLGLAISQRLSKLMNGRIDVTSTLGVGSRFTLALPLQESLTDADLVPENEGELYVGQENLRGLRILLVEDNPDNQQIFLHMLESEGIVPCIANDGREGLEMATSSAAGPFDLILMDMQMPVMDGFAATREIRRQGVSTPIVALTAYAMESDEKKCMDAGCSAFLTKPLVRSQLIKCMSAVAADLKQNAIADEAYVPPPSDKFAVLVEKYKSSLVNYREELQHAAAEDDTSTLAKISHRIAGTAANYGFADLGSCARQCNETLRQADTGDELQSQLLKLLTELDKATG